MRRHLILAVAVALGACTAAPSDGPVALQTNPQSGTPCLLVNLPGVLVADPTWGLALMGVDTAGHSHRYGVLWPKGWSARRDSGTILLIGSTGDVLARDGDQVLVPGATVADPSDVGPIRPCASIQVVASQSPGS